MVQLSSFKFITQSIPYFNIPKAALLHEEFHGTLYKPILVSGVSATPGHKINHLGIDLKEDNLWMGRIALVNS